MVIMKRRDKPITRTTFWLKKIKKSLWISLPSLIIAIVCYRAYSSPRHEVKKHVRQNELKKYNQESDVDVDEEDIMKLQGYFDKGNSLDIDRLSEDKAKSLCYTIFLLIKKYKMTNRQFSKQFFTNENTYEFICSDFWDQFQDTDSLPLQGVFIEEVIGPFMREIFTDEERQNLKTTFENENSLELEARVRLCKYLLKLHKIDKTTNEEFSLKHFGNAERYYNMCYSFLGDDFIQ